MGHFCLRTDIFCPFSVFFLLFGEKLATAIPTLHEHGCSYGEAGGFLRRVNENDGTWFGHYAYWMGIAAAFMTAFYSWRLIIMTFHGKSRADKKVLSSRRQATHPCRGACSPRT